MNKQQEQTDMGSWTAEQKAAYDAALSAATLEEGKLKAHNDAETRRHTSPEYLIQQLRERAEEAKEKREAEERRLLGERLYAQAQTQYGKDLVALIPTMRGPVIMRAATAKETATTDLEVDALTNPADQDVVWRRHTADLIVHPKPDDFAKIMDEFPGTWGILRATRIELSLATREAAVKKG